MDKKEQLLFTDATILTRGGEYIKNGYLLVSDGRIAYVGTEDPSKTHKPPEFSSAKILHEAEKNRDLSVNLHNTRRIDCRGGLLLSAFYNIHCHSPMTLFRGIGEDLPLQRWLTEKIYPAEDKLTPEKVYVGTLLAAAEMLRGGVVSFSDMYFFCEETAKAVLETHMKANVARCLVSFDENDSIHGNERFDEAVKLIRDFDGKGCGKLLVDLSVHAEYTNKPKFLHEVGEYSLENDTRMQVHVSETEAEHLECLDRHGKTPTAFLVDMGILHKKSTAAHCVWVSDDDMKLLAANGVTVAHNPVSNLKLASGIAPVDKLLDAGVNVGLGTDGAASNNRLSMIRELQTAALIHKGRTRRADIIKTWKFYEMSTKNGAIAQGRPDCGEIIVGNKADLCLIEMNMVNNIPMFDPYSALAYSVDPSDVRMTVADGEVLYEDGEYKTLDIEKVKHEFERLR